MEYLDIVDTNDNVIGLASKEDIYSKLLHHRIVHIIIFNDEGKMALQLRSPEVSFCPNHWSTAVGGHVQSGENYEEAALREYKEELGGVSTLEFVGKDYYSVPNRPDKFLATFKAVNNGPFVLESAVSKVEYFTKEEIRKMIEEGEKFHPELLFILNKYYFI